MELLSADDLTKKIEALNKKAEKIGQQLGAQTNSEKTLQTIADRMSLLCVDETILAKQFTNNLLSFKKYDSGIYDFFKDYQPTKFLLDIVDAFPNVIEIETNQHIYPFPAYLMATAQYENYQASPQSTSSMFEYLDDNEGNFIHSAYLNELIQILLDRVEKEPDAVRPLSKDVSSMIIFGAGLGLHIELLLSYHDFSSLYIIEPELDIFYASLYTANWAEILPQLDAKNTNLHFSLGPQQDDFFEDLLKQSFINGRYDVMKTFGYIHYHTEEISHLLGQYRERFYEMIQGWGFFDDAVMSIAHMLGNIKNHVPILKKDINFDFEFADTPVFIVGNGPSLDNLIDTLKENKDKALIISCGSALSALYEYGIIPDFHCEQERTFPVAEKIDYYCPKSVIDKLVFLAPSTVHPAVFEKFKRVMMAPKGNEPSTSLLLEDEQGKELFEAHFQINPTVANTALTFASCMGFKNCYLFGIDLGHKSGEKHHSSKSFYYDENEQDLNIYDDLNSSTLTAKGNFGGTFICDSFFNMSRKMLERFIAQKETLNCYNLCDGSYIDGTIPLHKEQLSLTIDIDKAKVIDCALDNAGHTYTDDAMYQRLVKALDYDAFDDLCNRLIAEIEKPTNSIQEAIFKLKQHTIILRDANLFISPHLYTLLLGSMLHMQAMLTRLIYESLDESEALKDFDKGLKVYSAFLQEADKYYKENATVPHYMDSKWLNPFRK